MSDKLKEIADKTNTTRAPAIVGTCYNCGGEYRELPGGMACANCGTIESFRMITSRLVGMVDTSLDHLQNRKKK